MTNSNFIGERLTYARNRKGISMQDVAELLDVQRQYIHKIETGKENKALSQHQIELIAKKLGVDSDFFYQLPKYTISHDRLHFRSVAIPNYICEQARILAEDVVSVCSFVRDFIEPLGLSFPEFHLDEIADSGKIKTDALYPNELEEITQKVRDVVGLGDGPISSMVRVLESQGIVVTSAENISEKVDAFCNNDYFPIVVRNDKKSPVRCRQDLGHELAHLIIHKGINNDIISNPYVEKQANYFASSLLLPRKSFIAEFPRFNGERIPWGKLLELKVRWKVSIASIIMRAHNLSLIDAETYSKAFIQISSKGWRTKEPLDDRSDINHIELEQPELIKNAVTLIMNTHKDMLPKMRETLKLDRDTIRKILGMPNLTDTDFEFVKPNLILVK